MVILINLFVAADSTPLGDQDILYLNGFSAATGSGSPPHKDTSSVTVPPLSWMLFTAFIMSCVLCDDYIIELNTVYIHVAPGESQ